jgi:hypothetical protein
LEQKRPRSRHRFDFDGRSEQNDEDRAATDQILVSLDLLAKAGRILDGEQENTSGGPQQIVHPLQSAQFSQHRSSSLLVIPAMLVSVVVFLWVFGLIPRMIYDETVGSIGILVAKIPSADIVIIVVIWIVAMGIGLLGRRVARSQAADD